MLLRVGQGDLPFLQYIPGNLQPLLGRPETVCVGAVFRGFACGIALAEETGGGEYHLRYLFVDPASRLCGLGTHLLRGLLGLLRHLGAQVVKAIYTPSMLVGGGQRLGVLERAGFSPLKPISTAFSVPLESIRRPEVTLPPGMAVYTAE